MPFLKGISRFCAHFEGGMKGNEGEGKGRKGNEGEGKGMKGNEGVKKG